MNLWLQSCVEPCEASLFNLSVFQTSRWLSADQSPSCEPQLSKAISFQDHIYLIKTPPERPIIQQQQADVQVFPKVNGKVLYLVNSFWEYLWGKNYISLRIKLWQISLLQIKTFSTFPKFKQIQGLSLKVGSHMKQAVLKTLDTQAATIEFVYQSWNSKILSFLSQRVWFNFYLYLNASFFSVS